jgi:multiple antibiotic resistance protein
MTGSMITPVEILIIFFVTLGPLKSLGPFAARTQGIADERLHRIALGAVVIATLAVVLGGLLGVFIVDRWRISLPAMTLSAGIIFFLVALNQLLQQYDTAQAPTPRPLPASSITAGAECVFPIVLTPYGIAAAITLLVASQAAVRTMTILGLLVFVMFLDLLAMWFVRRILVGFMAIVLQVLGAVLAVLQVALSVQFMLLGLRLLHLISA